jgi:hypothetical protein
MKGEEAEESLESVRTRELRETFMVKGVGASADAAKDGVLLPSFFSDLSASVGR